MRRPSRAIFIFLLTIALLGGMVMLPLNSASAVGTNPGTTINLTDNNTTDYGAGVSSGTGNAAYFIKANSESLTSPDNANISMGDINFTIFGWVKYTSLTTSTATFTTWHPLFEKGNGSGTALGPMEYSIFYRTDTGVSCTVGNGTTYGEAFNTSTTITTGNWYFYVCTYNATTDTISLYVNAGTPATASWTGGSYDSSNGLKVGSLRTSTPYLDGYVDEIGIYKNRELTADEISWLYNLSLIHI